jgi:hypothetical protein
MKLKPGEVICPECKGDDTWFCFRCAGTGKIDWVELCMKRNRTLIWGQKTLNMTLPLIRSMYPKLIAKDLVSVQPINWGEKDET